MNMKFLAKLAETHPACARLAEASIVSGMTYLLGAVIEGQVLSINALIVAVVTPLYLALTKRQRDVDKQRNN